ncbi:MAG: hypothetical protein OXB92_04220 [Acidimicrobiaceae bacterium]|nr:hypothetical protein [Acidimicrobiia bacterium]MCY4493049.1 hypothetical protein [Acidimicrobiaceae bacterium]
MSTVCVFACCASTVLAGCAEQDGAEGGDRIETVQETSTLPAETTIPQSVGLVRIGPSAYNLVFTCVDRGAGEILAVGVGRDVNNKPVEAFVQAFVAEPYIGVEVGDPDETVRFEPRLGALLDFTFDHDIVRFDEVDFVTDLDIETGDFTPAGIGSVVVECRSYETEIPDP